MITLMIAIFVIGYIMIAFERPLRINKASTALFIGTILWIIYLYIAPEVIPQVSADQFAHFIHTHPEIQSQPYGEQVRDFVINNQIIEMLGDISETLLFLMAAMTIVELIDVHGGFMYITDLITTRNKRLLLWLIGFITFFMSSILDNLTTTIVMIMLVKRLVPDRLDRLIYGSIIVIAANSGGAWSPIGDVTTIMLWVEGAITTKVIPQLFFPSLISMMLPICIAQFMLKGKIKSATSMSVNDENSVLLRHLNTSDRVGILIFGVLILITAPIFKAITHLPPFVWLLLGVSMMWIYTEVIYNHKKNIEENIKQRLDKIIGKLDFTTLLFFLGILMAVDALQSAGILNGISQIMSEKMPNVYSQAISIGLLSAIIDNVPLVAAAIGMYPTIDPALVQNFSDPGFMQNFVVDGVFWHFLAYCAGVGGSILIIGSAAGVVFMGLERVSFGWYFKRISFLALLGYLGGAAIYILQNNFF